MLDRKFIVEHADLVKQNCVDRGAHADVDGFVALEAQRKALQSQIDELNRLANELAKSIGKSKSAEERELRKDEGRQLRERTAAVQAEHDRVEEEALGIARAIPNLTHPAAPRGAG